MFMFQLDTKFSNIFYSKSLYIKFHSWQCIKLTIPSSRVNFAIGESINIICLKIICDENVFSNSKNHYTRNLCTKYLKIRKIKSLPWDTKRIAIRLFSINPCHQQCQKNNFPIHSLSIWYLNFMTHAMRQTLMASSNND